MKVGTGVLRPRKRAQKRKQGHNQSRLLLGEARHEHGRVRQRADSGGEPSGIVCSTHPPAKISTVDGQTGRKEAVYVGGRFQWRTDMIGQS